MNSISASVGLSEGVTDIAVTRTVIDPIVAQP